MENGILKFENNEPMELKQGDPITATDEFELAKKYLIPIAQEMMARKSYSLMVQENDNCYEYIKLIRCVKQSDKEEGIKQICHAINLLSGKGLIHSVLAPPSSIKLAHLPKQYPGVSTFCFPLVPSTRIEEVKALVGDLFQT